MCVWESGVTKIDISLQQLIEMEAHSRAMGTEREWMIVAIEWASGAHCRIAELEAELEAMRDERNRAVGANAEFMSENTQLIHKLQALEMDV